MYNVICTQNAFWPGTPSKNYKDFKHIFVLTVHGFTYDCQFYINNVSLSDICQGQELICYTEKEFDLQYFSIIFILYTTLKIYIK